MSRLSPSSLRPSRAPLRHGLGAAVLALGFMTGAQAGLFDDEEARQQILQLRTQLDQTQRSLGERIGELEAQARNRSIIDLFNQVEALKADFAKLRGQIEMLQNELDNSQKRQRDLYVDLDGRLRKIETQLAASATAQAAPGSAPSGTVAPAPATGAPAAAEPPRGLPSAPAVTPPAIDPVAEQRSYEAGLDLFRSGRFSEAIASFQSFLRTFSRSTLAPSAQYWIGNALYATRDYRGAITAQRQLLAQYPDSAKAPDALLNIATAQSDLGDLQGARSSLQEVIAKYPNSEAATKARQRLGGR
ncbi:MAG: tol-pal system protein YbgF [Proteobacteria bacterium]|nr:tol-pal system protein YbgF [Pseudomonadota bacterium]